MAKGTRGGKRRLTNRATQNQITVYDKAPKGYKIQRNATTAPLGTDWWTNGESYFSGKRKSILVKNKDWELTRRQRGKKYKNG